ncbi:uncharacterized protein B0H18DRAFT_1168789, partial [Fomitopsis serialis]|uniref:uncharacterized protein n=1 Tax=Fomitopsis serialis TaxID=139415 RepID=UPI0020085964
MSLPEEPSANAAISLNQGVEENTTTPGPDATPSPTTAVGSASLGSSGGDGPGPSSSNPAVTGTSAGEFPVPRDSASRPPNQDPHERTDGAENPPSGDPPAQGIAQSDLEKAFSALEKFMKPRNPTDAPEAWLKLADTAWAYEKDRADRWRNEINTLLVFAGLFSAVLTAFVVQLYSVLLPAPDPNTAILERIAAQLGNMATDAVASASVPVPTVLTNTSSTSISSPSAAPRWIAALWFVALVFSLSAASVGLAVNQWLNFHATEKAGLQDAAQKAWTWQLRRHAMDKWQVERMVSILPFLLQVALVLFLVGVVGYLWELGFDIAVPSTVFVGALLLFLAFTSVSPALVDYSAYKSP